MGRTARSTRINEGRCCACTKDAPSHAVRGVSVEVCRELSSSCRAILSTYCRVSVEYLSSFLSSCRGQGSSVQGSRDRPLQRSVECDRGIYILLCAANLVGEAYEVYRVGGLWFAIAVWYTASPSIPSHTGAKAGDGTALCDLSKTPQRAVTSRLTSSIMQNALPLPPPRRHRRGKAPH